jgi:hypothetical protein
MRHFFRADTIIRLRTVAAVIRPHTFRCIDFSPNATPSHTADIINITLLFAGVKRFVIPSIRTHNVVCKVVRDNSRDRRNANHCRSSF